MVQEPSGSQTISCQKPSAGNFADGQNVLIINGLSPVILTPTREVKAMTTPSLYPDWVYKELQNRLTEEEWKQLSTFLPAETWASPAAQKREWQERNTDIPLRFHLDIDMEI
jgi:hypothetical protein